MKRLIMTVGLPRSGKSTWAKLQGYPVVNPDSVRLALHGKRFITEREPEVWSIVHIMVESLFLAGHKVVIIDATNTTRKRRDWWKYSNWEIKYKLFFTSEKVCIKRAYETDKELVPIIKQMSKDYEPLTDEELEGLIV